MGDLTIDALKELYVALGGSADDVATVTLIPDMIHEIAEVAADLKAAVDAAAENAAAKLGE